MHLTCNAVTIRGLILACVWVMAADVAFTHGGGLDSLGCHNNRRKGVYECHRGPLQGQEFTSKAEAQAALDAGSTASPPGDTPTTSGVRYDRDLYGGWIDADGDCQDTRQEVLIEESLEAVILDERGCKVVSGKWYDPFTGKTFTNPRQLDIDHFIPLAEVHRSGSHSWTSSQRKSYANDLTIAETLIAVSASANRSKGDKDPAHWLPPNSEFHCKYVEIWFR